MKNLKPDSKAYEVFQKEYNFYTKSQKVLSNSTISKDELQKEYKSLHDMYVKLLSNSIKMTIIADSAQRKLMFANQMLKEKENEIKNLLSETLSGSVKILREVLSIVMPIANLKASLLRDCVIKIVNFLELPDDWIYEMSSMLCFTGYISLNRSLIDYIYKYNVTDNEEYNNHPNIGYKFISFMPRLDILANIVKNQQKPFKEYPYKKDLKMYEPADLGAQIIKASIDYCNLIDKDYSHNGAIEQMSKKLNLYHPQLLDIIKKVLES